MHVLKNHAIHYSFSVGQETFFIPFKSFPVVPRMSVAVPGGIEHTVHTGTVFFPVGEV